MEQQTSHVSSLRIQLCRSAEENPLKRDRRNNRVNICNSRMFRTGSKIIVRAMCIIILYQEWEICTEKMITVKIIFYVYGENL